MRSVLKYLVLPPVTLLIVLLLFTLMSQLAGFTNPKMLVLSDTQSDAQLEIKPASVFDMSSISFSSESDNNPTLDITAHYKQVSTLPEEVELPVLLEILVKVEKNPVQEEQETAVNVAELKSSNAQDIIVKTVAEKVLEKLKPTSESIKKPDLKVHKKIVRKPIKKPVSPQAQKNRKDHKRVKKPLANKSSKSSNQKTEALNAKSGSKSSSKLGSHVSNAKPVHKNRPAYPKRARRRGIEGEVVVYFIVNKNGSVDRKSLRITYAKPAKVFNKAVLKAVSKWKFAASNKSFKTSQKLVFSLRK